MDVMLAGCSKELLYTYPQHQHGYWEIIFHTQGKGILTADGVEYLFNPGDISVIPPRTPHKKESAEGFMDMCLFIRDFRPVGNQGFRMLTDDADGTFCTIMQMAQKYYEQNGFYEQAVLNVIGDLIYQLLVLFFVKHQKKDPRLEGIMEVMQNNLNNPDFDLSRAIADTGYSSGYFRRIFKEFTGTAPVNYMQAMRIEYAKSLMNQYGRSRSIKDVAASSGFRDPLYFSRLFKKLEGISPTEYLSQQADFDPEQVKMDEKLTAEDIRQYERRVII